MGIHDTDPDTILDKEFAPEGWHVPTDAEWTTLEEHLIANGYNYDGTTTGNKIAKAMASTTGWNSATNTGASRQRPKPKQRSGFNAFPEGYRYPNGRSSIEGARCDSFGVPLSTIWIAHIVRDLNVNSSNLGRNDDSVQVGFSVRFVRD